MAWFTKNDTEWQTILNTVWHLFVEAGIWNDTRYTWDSEIINWDTDAPDADWFSKQPIAW